MYIFIFPNVHSYSIIYKYEALGSHGAGATGWISSSQVTKRQGQDERRTAALDPLRPAC